MPRYRRSADVLSAEVGDDVVALQAVRGFAYGMEGVTAAVWQQLEAPVSLDQIVTALGDEYEVEAEQCRGEVVDLIHQFVGEGLVEEVA